MEIYSDILREADRNIILFEARLKEIAERLQKNLYEKLLITLTLFLLSFIFLEILINIKLIKPLEELKKSTDELSKKNFDHEIRVSGNDETGQLAAHFNRMASNLKEVYSDLENKIRERTRELENSNCRLLDEISERRRMEKTLKKQALTDDLTGLLNRRAAYTFLSELRSKLDIEFSYGLSEFSILEDVSLDELIKKTDKKMYSNKREKKQRAPIPLTTSLI